MAKLMSFLGCSDSDIVSPVLHFKSLFPCEQWRTETRRTYEHKRDINIICEEVASSQLDKLHDEACFNLKKILKLQLKC